MCSKILFIDDDKRILDSYQRLFKNKFELELFTNPKLALKLLKTHSKFTVIVSDLKMPGMSGIDFLAKAKEYSPDSVRILLTGYADYENAVAAINRGYIFRFLSKPCDPQILEQTLYEGVKQHKLILAEREVHSLKKLKRLMDGIVEGLSTIIEARDPYTGGHQRRVAQLSIAIGSRLGFESDRIKALHTAGMLHDIGKVYVPSDFLNKPGFLNKQEMAVVRLHPEVGANIFESVEYDWPIHKFIRQHHERLDGSGYPDGLCGDDISLEACILAVADVVDAMVSRRPYRDSLGMQAAIDELKNKKGIIYDKNVVDQCLIILANDELSFE